MRSALLTAALAATTALAFKDTSPLLIWSSEADEALTSAQSEITSGVLAADEIYDALSSVGCGWKTLVVAHSEGLHNSKVAALTLPSTSADLNIPYLLRPRRDALDGAIDKWAKICGADVGTDLAAVTEGKNVVNVDIAADQDISSLLKDLPTPYIFILTGSHPSTPKTGHPKSKRQEVAWPSASDETIAKPLADSSSRNGTVDPRAPLLQRVQIITVPIITGLLVVFLILLPILYVGISALAGIQVPPRLLEIGKSVNVNQERKDR